MLHKTEDFAGSLEPVSEALDEKSFTYDSFEGANFTDVDESMIEGSQAVAVPYEEYVPSGEKLEFSVRRDHQDQSIDQHSIFSKARDYL